MPKRSQVRVSITTRGLARWLARPSGRVLLALVFAVFVACGVAFIHYYNFYAEIIDARLASPIFHPSSLVFATPKVVAVGENLTPQQLSNWLTAAGYAAREASPVGTFLVSGDSVRIAPGPEAYHATIPVQVQFQNGEVTTITDLQNQQAMDNYALAPELLTTLFNEKRIKRRIVRYQDLPPMLIQAVLDTEDKGFFQHGAVNWPRVVAAAYRDVRAGRKEQGASTIAMQVARNIFDLGFEKTAKRKLEEVLVAMELEERLTKQQIFELYANQLYMGQRGSYAIHGFGEAADAYFGKPVNQLTLPEDALLAGIIHAPNGDSPYRHPKRAQERRDGVLRFMVADGAITEAQRLEADKAPLVTTAANNEASDAPYFTEMVRDRLSDAASNEDLSTESYRIYTTLNPELQAAAAQAVSEGMVGVDKELAALRRARHHGRQPKKPEEKAQVALVALDPHTGAVLALVGGRNFAFSQLNHALAQRPTGSIFKPIVYATALETGLLPNLPAITQSSILNDEPTVFPGGYAPANFENKYFGPVTLRVALEHSLNNATITLAEEVGLQAVTDLAHAAGITSAEPTPSEAIGTYTASPLTMAGVYTMFDNGGVLEKPRLIDSVQDAQGQVILQHLPKPKRVLDPRIAFLTTNLMESVLQAGTAVRVRAMGFDVPAAGKTGTSHDAWFAGFTDNLLCVVWVGLDNYQDIDIEGAHAALPIWTDFMKAAIQLPGYSHPQPFAPPPGVVAVKVDTVSHEVATPLCPPDQTEVNYYIDGTQPTVMCHLHPSPLIPRGIAEATHKALQFLHVEAPPPPEPAAATRKGEALPPRLTAAPATELPAAKPKPQPKRGFFGRLLHAIGGGGDSKNGGGGGGLL
ncbi:MAG: penicillin-binding protein 1A [Acidobacteria bacterium]|nr:MAG: penicillin-binding protein 1A [Acidobacteriota bacterium]